MLNENTQRNCSASSYFKSNDRKVFSILIEAGFKTAFVNSVSDTVIVLKKCQMIPIESVSICIAVRIM